MIETGQTLNSSIKDMIAQLHRCIDSFSALSKELLDMVKHDAQATRNVATYTEMLEYSITGNYYWS